MDEAGTSAVTTVADDDTVLPTSDVVPASTDAELTDITDPPMPEFELDYAGAFGADEINEFRAGHPDYADIPMPNLGPLDGTHLVLRGSITQDGDRLVDTLLFATGDEYGVDSPIWSMDSVPGFTIGCTGGTITTIRGDENGCRYGVGWQWSEVGRTWRIEGHDGQPGDEFVAQLILQ